MQAKTPDLADRMIAYLERATVGDVLAAARKARSVEPDASRILLCWMLWAHDPNRTQTDYSTVAPTELFVRAERLRPEALAYGAPTGRRLFGALAEYAIQSGIVDLF